MSSSKAISRRAFIQASSLSAAGIAVIPLAGSWVGPGGEDSLFSPRIHWAGMIEAFDLIWTSIPKNMSEAPHFGNGLLGSMIWIEEGSVRLQVFRSDVHDHGTEKNGWTAYSRPRYQIGYFTCKPRGIVTGCHLRQNLYDAELTGSIQTSEGSIRITHFVHKQDDILFTEFQADEGEVVPEITWHPFPAKYSRGGGPGDKTYGQVYAPYSEIRNPDPVQTRHDDVLTCCQDLATGGNYTTAWQEAGTGERVSRLITTIQNSFPGMDSKEKAIQRVHKGMDAIKSGFNSWRKEHRTWWHTYYPESFVWFPDPAGESFYWNNVYKLACCTRPDAQYIDTAGMWNMGGPWPYSTHDFNTQTAHFPVYTANRLHLGEALVNSVRRNKATLVDNVVPSEWQSDSAYLGLATAFDLIGKRDEDVRYNEMFGCLPWLLNNIWLHYRYTMDPDILRDPLFPLLRRSVNLYRHILYEGSDGRLHLPSTFVPESGVVPDSNFDLALLRWSCTRLIEICEILKISDPLAGEWRRILDNLTDYAADGSGYMLGPGLSAPADHQHMSHLMMIYPLYLENIDTGRNRELMEKSVRNFNPTSMPRMAASQSSPAASALGLGELALERMNDILHSEAPDEKLGKNGIYYLATPCIETSLSYNTCLQDMLLQSWGGTIRVFPAVPDIWQDVEFHHFRAEGGFLVSAKRENGLTVWVKILSLAGGPCRIRTSIPGLPTIRGKFRVLSGNPDDGTLELGIKKGDEVLLKPS